MDQAPITPNSVKLKASLPRNWERAFGYEGKEPFIAAYWEPGGDEAICEDAWSSFTADWAMYQWLEHQVINPQQLRLALAGTNFGRWSLGSSEIQATHCLLMSVATREIWVTPRPEAAQLMRERSQYKPPELPADFDWTKFHEVMEAEMQKRQEWLNNAVACPNCHLAGWLLQRDGGFDVCPTCNGKKFISKD